MHIEFEVDGTHGAFDRNQFTGRAELHVGNEKVVLASPAALGTHFSPSLTRVFQHRVGNRDVVIEITRPILLAGFRASTYRVMVDGQLVAEEHGR